MSKGEKIIGSFNTDSNEAVNAIKSSAVLVIDCIDKAIPDGRRKTQAINLIEQAQMMAVKELFQPEED